MFNSCKTIDGKEARMVGWAHPSLICLLQVNRLELFIDATFRSVPSPFYQCLIVMTKDGKTNVFVPVFYVLMSGKTERQYSAVLKEISNFFDELNPSFVHCDFEVAMMNAIKGQFKIGKRDSKIAGCFFHWKQAIQKKVVKLDIPEKEKKY
jgi:hypothetical protein